MAAQPGTKARERRLLESTHVITTDRSVQEPL